MQINYLLKRFPKTEWSGPAWYKLEDEEWNLVHFIPIDLGSSGATEFKGKALLKTMKEVQKTVDITGCFQGIIHSHHGLGAFHSGTDDTELEEGANKVGYASLVVAHTDRTHAFKFSYEDQFGQIHLEKGTVSVEMPDYKPMKIWVNQANVIEKKSKKTRNSLITHHGNQGNMWSGYGYSGWGENKEDKEFREARDEMQVAKRLHSIGKITDAKFKKMEKDFDKVESDYYGVIS